MKKLLSLLLLLVSLAGCATNPQRSLAATQNAIYGAKKTWVAYLQAEYKRIDNLPATEQIPLRDALAVKRARAHALAAQIDAAWWAAWIAAKYDSRAKPPSELLLLIADFKLLTTP